MALFRFPGIAVRARFGCPVIEGGGRKERHFEGIKQKKKDQLVGWNQKKKRKKEKDKKRKKEKKRADRFVDASRLVFERPEPDDRLLRPPKVLARFQVLERLASVIDDLLRWIARIAHTCLNR